MLSKIEQIVEIIEEANNPLTQREILKRVTLKFGKPNHSSIRSMLSIYTRKGLLKYIKPEKMAGAYGNPKWFDEEGNLLPGYQIETYWKK